MADIEKWSGNRTVLMHGMNRSGGTVESAGANLGETRRAVLQSEDIRAIGTGRQIMRVAGSPHLFVCDRVHFDDVNPWKHQLRDVRNLHNGSAL
jgi:type IV secretion system protein VirD4